MIIPNIATRLFVTSLTSQPLAIIQPTSPIIKMTGNTPTDSGFENVSDYLAATERQHSNQ